MQRIPRYILIAREFQKYTPEHHSEYAAIQQFVTTFTASVQAMQRN
jgi:hypothetical protein